MIASLPPFNDFPLVDKDGKMTTDSLMYNDQLWQSLNIVVVLLNGLVASNVTQDGAITNQGVTLPSYTTSEIIALEPNVDNGTIWFNTSLSKLQVKTSTGTIETIQSV